MISVVGKVLEFLILERLKDMFLEASWHTTYQRTKRGLHALITICRVPTVHVAFHYHNYLYLISTQFSSCNL